MPKEFNYLTIEEVAEMLKVARSTVYKFKEMGLPFIKLGKVIRFELKDVVNWVDQQKICLQKEK
ncbi:MAG: helix-turn-helix domain-containing protein [Dethiobacteria bacterium]|jgi:excisionase family DNA binding protein